MNKKVKWTLFSIAAIVVIFIVARAVLKKDADTLKVTAEAAKRRTITETVSASGKLYPETEIKIGSPITGEITQLNVQEGDSIKKGQILARIQGEKGTTSAPRITLPNVPPGFEGLLQSMQQPRAASTQTAATITAPIGGTVTSLTVRRGERIGVMQMPGTEMMRIADLSNIEVRVDVNENNIIKISVGDSADVEVEAYNKRKFKGIVTSIANGSTKRDAQSFLSNDVTNYEVHIRLNPSSYADLFDTGKRRNMPFRPGMNARAEIQTKKKENVLSIPVGAVVSKAKGRDDKPLEEPAKNETELSVEEESGFDELEEVVYLLKADGTAEKRAVTTGIQDMAYFEIVSGLKEGEQVITGPYSAVSKTIHSGKKVKVVSKEKLFQND